MIFFEEEKGTTKGGEPMERKMQQFFKGLRKSTKDEEGRENKVSRDGRDRRWEREERDEPHGTEPYLVTRRTELPPSWDGPYGTVVLIDKPKGICNFLSNCSFF